MLPNNKEILDSSLLIRAITFLFLCGCLSLVACGGGGGKGNSKPTTASSQPTSLVQNSISVSSVSVSSSSETSSVDSSATISSASSLVNLTGQITYDFIPHRPDGIGLDYSAITAKPGRGLVIELVDSNNAVLAITSTDSAGNYSFSVDKNRTVKVRVKAQLLQTHLPTWNFKVTDNTQSNKLYAMEGSLVEANDSTAVRNLHAASGWSGISYSQPRVAAPFAILDSIYEGIIRVALADVSLVFRPLELRWSANNKAADGEYSLGEIGTSFYDGSGIYILGDENNDTDEYDSHVILHEWGHYLEDEFARSDSIGGDHAYGEKMDMRVAMSEGFANAFSAMMLDDPIYRDASGVQQGNGFITNVSHKNHVVRGWYSEASVQSVLYNFYASGDGKDARNFSDIFKIIHSPTYASNPALISIYVFADELRAVSPAHTANFNDLLSSQNIEISDAFGTGESNSGGSSRSLPVYKPLPVTNIPVHACSTNEFGTFNKLAVSQFLLLEILSPGNYQINVQESAVDSGDSDPDIYLYHRGELIDVAESAELDQENFSSFLLAGTYVLELVDDRVRNSEKTVNIEACFDVSAQRIN